MRSHIGSRPGSGARAFIAREALETVQRRAAAARAEQSSRSRNRENMNPRNPAARQARIQAERGSSMENAGSATQ